MDGPKPFQLPKRLAERTVVRQQGQISSTHAITQKDRDGNERVLVDKHKSALVPGAAEISNPAYAGKEFILTIPGPEKSYMSARVGISVYLPFDSSLSGAARDTLLKVDELIDEVLVEDAKQCELFFEKFKRR